MLIRIKTNQASIVAINTANISTEIINISYDTNKFNTLNMAFDIKTNALSITKLEIYKLIDYILCIWSFNMTIPKSKELWL